MIAGDAEVADVAVQPLPDGATAVVVTAKSDPYSPAARDLVGRLRHGALSRALPGVPYQVGGDTAAAIDATDAMFAGLPKVGLALLLVVGLLLLFALRSVFLPLKAVVLVVLSLGASLLRLTSSTASWISRSTPLLKATRLSFGRVSPESATGRPGSVASGS